MELMPQEWKVCVAEPAWLSVASEREAREAAAAAAAAARTNAHGERIRGVANWVREGAGEEDEDEEDGEEDGEDDEEDEEES